MTQLPGFHKGMQPGDMVASEMQRQSDLVAAFQALTVTPPLRMQRGHKSMTLSIDPSSIPMPLPEQTVVITDILTHTLVVKPVRYKAIPPIQCVGDEPDPRCGIEVLERSFTAHPDFGTKPADYTGMRYSPPVSATTQYAKVYHNAGVWIVKMPSGGAGGAPIPVNITSAPTAEPDELTVQPLKWDEGGENLENDGETITVKPWPDRTNDTYKDFIGKPDVFAMFNLAGQQCVYHHIRFDQTEPPEGAVIEECA